MKAEDIIAAARSVIGTPFRHQGRSEKGRDCVGLLAYIGDCLNIEYLDISSYSPNPSGSLLEEALDSQPNIFRIRDFSDMQAGDILVMRFRREPQHVAIFTGENIIHSYSTVGICCEHILDNTWRRRIVRIYRIVGVEI